MSIISEIVMFLNNHRINKLPAYFLLHSTFATMQIPRLTKLFLFIIYIFSVKGEFSKEKVVLVAPVLAPPNNSRARVVETAKDFPVLMLLSTNSYATKIETEIKGEPQPIYVEKLEDQKIHTRISKNKVLKKPVARPIFVNKPLN